VAAHRNRTRSPKAYSRVVEMRDPNRIPLILDQLRSCWLRYPDLRLGQLIIDAAGYDNPFFLEDDDLIKAINDMFADTHKEQTAE